MHPSTARIQDVNTDGELLYIGIDLGKHDWYLAATDGSARMSRKITAGDFAAIEDLIDDAAGRFELGDDVQVLSCYEAGSDGFWVHRRLTDMGYVNLVVHPDGQEDGAKTDRLDAGRLARMYVRFVAGDDQIFKPVHVPSPRDEDDRRLHRERRRLIKERTGHINRIMKLLGTRGLDLEVDPADEAFVDWLESVRGEDGRPLGRHLKAECRRERERMLLADRQIDEIEARQEAYLDGEGHAEKSRQIKQLMMLKGIGLQTAWILVMEMYGWRQFNNRREVGAYAGLCGQPDITGGSGPDRGIGKRGNKWVRWIAIELAWNWLRWQPDSELSRWFQARFADHGGRMRRRGIVGLARKLLNRLRIFVHDGEVPREAVFSTS